jgi:hypothetical protein
MSRLHLYNADMNIPQTTAALTLPSNQYFAQTATQNADALLAGAKAANTDGAVYSGFGSEANVFPLLPLAVT